MSHPEPFVPSDAALADLRLALRGVRLPLDILGTPLGNDHAEAARPPGSDHAGAAFATARLRIPSDLARQVDSAGSVVLADEEGRPIATLRETSVAGGGDRGGAVVQGRLEPVDPSAWTALTPPGDGPVVVLVARRPLLAADLAQLRSLRNSGRAVVVVPVAGPSLDGLPAALLLQLVTGAVGGDVTAPPVHVVPVELFWRDPQTDTALARAVAHELGAPDATPMTAGARDWTRLLAALDHDAPLPLVADGAVLRELRRWRPPRSRRGLVVLLTGLSGSGKSTLARALAAHVRETTDRTVSLLDGDLVRRLLSSDLGFDRASRDLNVRRIGFVAAEAARHGGIAICAPIAPYAESRAAVRAMAEQVGDFVLVHVSTPLAEAERRDVKGLYARARAGLIENFTGINDPYDEPTDADLALDTSELSIDDALGRLVGHLEQHGWLAAAPRER